MDNCLSERCLVPGWDRGSRDREIAHQLDRGIETPDADLAKGSTGILDDEILGVFGTRLSTAFLYSETSSIIVVWLTCSIPFRDPRFSTWKHSPCHVYCRAHVHCSRSFYVVEWGSLLLPSCFHSQKSCLPLIGLIAFSEVRWSFRAAESAHSFQISNPNPVSNWILGVKLLCRASTSQGPELRCRPWMETCIRPW